MKKLNFKAFTLVEMLIVIVIIGILIAALLPRLQGAQGRARDVARKNNLNQIGTAIAAFVSDYGVLPADRTVAVSSGIVSSDNKTVAELLLAEGVINNVPKDPQTAAPNWMNGITVAGDFVFVPMQKNKVPNGGFALVSFVEVPGSANRVYDGGTTRSGGYLSGVDIQELYPCTSVAPGDTTKVGTAGDTKCTYSDGTHLRYIYMY